ncbi:hypothetical protein Y032_1220g3764 [Ancylostoma ceylanicum]|uniref:RNA-directed DNA polymerase n=1 Tax=Ancylostoma ceylanicum TaxID=53326 RepID=A0A016W7J1_9BILA|nr:hypothetical protein Y032_1220g3764 [Ancylostoma ceylanicum]
MVPVYDASGNRMTFLGAVKIWVELEGGKKSEVAFHISDVKDDDILIGTNSLKELGVQLTFIQDETKHSEEVKEKRVVVAKRIYIPPHASALVEARCEGESEVEERVVWPKREGLAAGVFKIRNQELDIPVMNSSAEPIILHEGEELGQWGTEKWKEGWEDLNPLMMDTTTHEINGEARQKVLYEQVRESSKVEQLSEEIKAVLDEFPDAFSVCDRELTGTNRVEMDIDTGDNKPIKMKARSVPLGIRKKLRELLEDLENRKIIEKSSSAWAFPIVLVEKKDGSLRLCVDYRELNKRIKLDSYPLPTIDAVLQSLAGKRFFSTLDLCSGYWQIPLSADAREKSAFTTTEGLFQFRVTPFGLSTSPPVFQRLMDSVLHDLLGADVFCYIDDIIICTDTREKHIELLRQVCARLKEAGLRLKAQKCVLMQTQVSFLGHVIDSEGVHMDPKKVEAISRYEAPKNVKELRTFLGMASFYRKFCLGFSKVAGCLFALTSSKSVWKWSKEHKEAFDSVKEMIMTAPVLMQPDIERARDGSRPFVICTDASTTGLGAVLSQEGDDRHLHPVYFASKGLSRAERRYHVTDLEALAVVFAVRRFHMFIYGLPTVVLTDHQPLTALFNRSNVSACVLRWSLEIQRYNLEIKYVKGKTNVVADALSRGTAQCESWESIQGVNEAIVNKITAQEKSRWLKELENDPDFGPVIDELMRGNLSALVNVPGWRKSVRVADFEIEGGDLKMYQEDGRLVMVVPKSARYEIFHEAHAGTFAGHFSAHKLWNRLRKEVFWPNMLTDISRWTKECQKCFLHNPKAAVVPPLKPIVTAKPYEIIGVDVLELGLTASGNRYAVTVIDHFSKYAAAYPVPDKSAETVAKVVFLRWIAEGCRWPRTILSDKGGEFENKVMAELTKITKIEHITTKGYNPRENGVTERLNGTVVAMLRRSTVLPMEWDLRLPFCMMAYNLTPHSSTGESPYFILHGMDPNFPSAVVPNGGISWYMMDEGLEDYKAQLLQGIAETHERVREYNDRVREKMKRTYDKRNKTDVEKHAKVGDRVYLLSPNEKAMSSHPKLACEWAGPFRVLETSQNSALITRIGENSEPVRVQFDMLRIVPPCIPDDRVDTVTTRGKRGRKPKVKVNKIMISCSRGATIRTKADKGHLLYVCKDDCFNETRLGDLKGIQFPGAVAKQPIGSMWNAWRAASIFVRTDIDMASKIKFWKDGAMCLDEEALGKVLRVAYDRCLDWTEFICVTEGIKKHEKIDAYGFEKTYDSALKKLKSELQTEEKERRPIKEGPTAFAAPASAALLEKDGPRRGISTKVTTTFKQLREALNEWKSNKIWVIVWPADERFTDDEICEIVKACDQQFEDGGRVITAWPPLVEKNSGVWKKMAEIWSMLDETIKKRAGPGQCVITASSRVETGRVFCEIGVPEACLFYYGSDCSVACAKTLYETIRRRVGGAAPIPELKPLDSAPVRALASDGGSMWRSRHSRRERSNDRPAKRRDFGANFAR